MSASKCESLITVFGGSGFLGRHVVRALAQRGDHVRVAVRRPHLAAHLRRSHRQVQVVRADVRDRDLVEAAVRDANVVVNLVGILVEHADQRFDAVHAAGAATIAGAAAQVDARVIHISAIGADRHSRAGYARSKARGEALVLAEAPDAIILRPSIIFGPDDDFLNRFAAMAQISPVLPLIGGGHTRFQPVHVGDVAKAVAAAVAGRAKRGTTYELGGPEVKTFRELLEFVLATTGQQRLLVPVPFALAGLQASVLQFLPSPPLTPDQVELLKNDNVVSAAAAADGRTFAAFGIAPVSMAEIVPTYLRRRV